MDYSKFRVNDHQWDSVRRLLKRWKPHGFSFDPGMVPLENPTKVIQAILCALPLPPLHVYESPCGYNSVIFHHGEYFHAVQSFLEGTWKLGEIPFFPELKGLFFGDLSPYNQRLIQGYVFRFVLIDSRTPPEERQYLIDFYRSL